MVNHPHRSQRGGAASSIPEQPVIGFGVIKHAVIEQFRKMGSHALFRTGIDKDAMWDCYLKSFPADTNPIMRKRTEHDCSCCRQFIRAVGNVVTVIDNKLVSIWDIDCDDPVYGPVAAAMSSLVKSKPIDNQFLHTEGSAGTNRNFENGDDGVKTWEHFFINIPNSRVCRGADMGTRLMETRATHDVFLRGLTEITIEALDTVLELIDQNSLYRGEEHKHAVSRFKEAKINFDKLAPEYRDNFAWSRNYYLSGAVSMIRSTAIGTLLVDLSKGVDMDDAVKAFEALVAPTNYKRPTALVTKAMVEKARQKLKDLGLVSALERRYARITDITATNVLFADRSARKAMAGDVFDDIVAAQPVKPEAFEGGPEITINQFIDEVLPRASSLELLIENRHVGNLVSLVAPVDPKSGLLFKWPNRFSWSYNGDVADSIRERVKRAGGNVTGDLCCRLAWSNYDDLDFHMGEPQGREIAYYCKGPSANGGQLDVDMNAGSGQTREPVENIFYRSASTMRAGVYTLYVHQYMKREPSLIGFEAEIDWRGNVYSFAYDKALRQDERVIVAEIHYSHERGIEIIEYLPATTVSKKSWGIGTKAFHRVNVVMLSPNHWDGHGVGNRHYFFMLDGCRNDGSVRGFYNEFLKAELEPHRKVFEIVGSRMRTEESSEQLSGLGFSSTKRDNVVVRVGGSSVRTLRIIF